MFSSVASPPTPTPYFCTLLRFSSPSRVLGKGKETAAMQASQYHQVCPQARELYSSLCISQPTQLLCQVHWNSSTIIHLNQLVPKNKEIQWTAACDPSFHLTKEALMPSQFLVDYFQPWLAYCLGMWCKSISRRYIISHCFLDRQRSSMQNNSQIERQGLVIVFDNN